MADEIIELQNVTDDLDEIALTDLSIRMLRLNLELTAATLQGNLAYNVNQENAHTDVETKRKLVDDIEEMTMTLIRLCSRLNIDFAKLLQIGLSKRFHELLATLEVNKRNKVFSYILGNELASYYFLAARDETDNDADLIRPQPKPKKG